MHQDVLYSYSGTFDGQGHTVSGLFFNNTSVQYVGLFGVNSGTIQNVGVVDSYLNGLSLVGGVCGYNLSGTITNCYNTGKVIGSGKYIGGMCGYNYGGTITNCYNTGKVIGSGNFIGGICGDNYSGTITNSDNTKFANDVMIYGQNAALDGTIDFNIFVAADDNYEWSAKIDGAEVTKPAKDEKGLYKFTCKVAAKDMAKNIEFYINENVKATPHNCQMSKNMI